MNNELELELYQKVIRDLGNLFKVNEGEIFGSTYEEAMGYFENRLGSIDEKFEVLVENKELLMQERAVYEERVQEITYENAMLKNKIESL